MSRERTRRDLVDRIIELEGRIKALETVSRIGTTSIDSGELVVNGGDIVIKNSSGEVVLRINSSLITFYPIGPTGGTTTIDSYYTTAGPLSTEGPGMTLGVKTSAGIQSGGILNLDNDNAAFGYQPSGISPNVIDANTSKLVFGSETDTKLIYMQGHWDIGQSSRYQACIVDTFSIGSGFSSLTYLYGMTVPDNMVPIVTLTGATATTWAITGQDASGFTIAWGDTAARGVNIWALRTVV